MAEVLEVVQQTRVDTFQKTYATQNVVAQVLAFARDDNQADPYVAEANRLLRDEEFRRALGKFVEERKERVRPSQVTTSVDESSPSAPERNPAIDAATQELDRWIKFVAETNEAEWKRLCGE